MAEAWEIFAGLFDGFERAHGEYDLSRPDTSEVGKVKGRAKTVAAPVLEPHWRDHLNGIGPGLGIIPLKLNNTLNFAVIDIDVYNLDHAGLEKAIAYHKFPLVICKSKSGGAHCYVFFKEPTPAGPVREKLAAWAAALGFGGVEVFPKQSYRSDVDKDIGNWINLPYYRAQQPDRQAFIGGKLVDLSTFLEHAVHTRVDPGTLDLAKAPAETLEGDDEGFLEGAPPCLCHFAATGGVPSGMRNEAVFNMAAYLKKRYPDDWAEKLPLYNARYCSPSLPIAEVNGVVKSMKRKDYDVKCNGPHCDRKKCRLAKFGVGETAGSGKRPEISNLTKYEGDPVLWAIEIEGVRVMCNTETLLSQAKFNQFCMEKINRVPGSLPKARWEEHIDELLRQVDVVPVPEDATKAGQFAILLENFCTFTNRQAKTMDEVKLGKPYRHDNKVYFISRALIEYMDEKRFRYESEHQVWQWLREKFKAEKEFKKFKTGSANVWHIQDIWEHAPKPEIEINFDQQEF